MLSHLSQYFIVEVARVAQKAPGDVVGMLQARKGVIYDTSLLEFELAALRLIMEVVDWILLTKWTLQSRNRYR